MLPSDVTGTIALRGGELAFRPGPVFTKVVLADEINRTPPKTQAALLEAMQERQVTVDGERHPLPEPFVVRRHAEPGRVRGHLPAARGAARSLPGALDVGYPSEEDELRDAAPRAPRRRRRPTLDDVRPVG